MRKARLVTIGTEITCGEIVNSNASWISLRLEDAGVRVFSHLSVRDQRDEILAALATMGADDLVVVTGGLGPTSDDMTRACVAEWAGVPLEFDETVWRDLQTLYRDRGLPLREAHRHQCFFPAGSTRLPNAHGTALGFHMRLGAREVFVLPGPPRELEGMWRDEVEPRLAATSSTARWVRWTCLGAPESEIAELVESVIAGEEIEVGYRAQVPYVKVKIYVDPVERAGVVAQIDAKLERFIVARGTEDLAEELLRRWPQPELTVFDPVTDTLLISRLLKAKGEDGPRLALHASSSETGYGIFTSYVDDDFVTEMRLPGRTERTRTTLPYKTALRSARGRRSAAEWVLWNCVKALRG